ncbi:MAG: TetR/AcrR family transcriptional regulator [Phycisphaerae bacterium]|nr:TetR/AcrR family transcriptional regulator [Phycisphaerae bacterium]
MAQDTRQRLIRTAHDLFYEQGFHAVGLDAILSTVGVTKTTFYNHFESKDDLVSEVLRWHDRWWRDTFCAMLRKTGGDTPRGQLEAMFDVVEEFLVQDEYNGCFFVNVAVQFPRRHDPAHIAAAEHKKAMEDIIRELAGYAGAADPKAFAQEMSLVLEGAYVTRQITGNPDTSAIAKRIARMLMEKYLPAASPAGQ